MNKILKLLSISFISMAAFFSSTNDSSDELKVKAEEVNVINDSYKMLYSFTKVNDIDQVDELNYFNNIESDSLAWYVYQNGMYLDYENGLESTKTNVYNWISNTYYLHTLTNSNNVRIRFTLGNLEKNLEYANKYFKFWKSKIANRSEENDLMLIPFIKIDSRDYVSFMFDDENEDIALYSPYCDINYVLDSAQYENVTSGNFYLDLKFNELDSYKFEYNALTINVPTFRTNNGYEEIGLNRVAFTDSSNAQAKWYSISNIANDGSFRLNLYDEEIPNLYISVTQANGTENSTIIYSQRNNNWYSKARVPSLSADIKLTYLCQIKEWDTLSKLMNQGSITFYQKNSRIVGRDDYISLYSEDVVCPYVFNKDSICSCYIDTTLINVPNITINWKDEYALKVNASWFGEEIYNYFENQKINELRNNANKECFYQSFCFDMFFDKARTLEIHNVNSITMKYKLDNVNKINTVYIDDIVKCNGSVLNGFLSINKEYDSFKDADSFRYWIPFCNNSIDFLVKVHKESGTLFTGDQNDNYKNTFNKFFKDLYEKDEIHEYTYLNKVNIQDDGSYTNFISNVDPLKVTYTVKHPDGGLNIWIAVNTDTPVYIVGDEVFYFNGQSAKSDGYLIYEDKDSGEKVVALDSNNDGKATFDEIVDGHGEFKKVNKESDVIGKDKINFDFMDLWNNFSSNVQIIIKVVLSIIAVIILLWVIKVIVKLFRFTNRRKNRRR